MEEQSRVGRWRVSVLLKNMKYHQINPPPNTANKTARPQDLKHLKWKFFPHLRTESHHQFHSRWNQYWHTFFSQGSHLPGFGCSWGSAGGSRRAGCQPMERRYEWTARRVSWATRAVPAPHGSGWWRSCDWAATGSWLVCCPPAERYRHASGNFLGSLYEMSSIQILPLHTTDLQPVIILKVWGHGSTGRDSDLWPLNPGGNLSLVAMVTSWTRAPQNCYGATLHHCNNVTSSWPSPKIPAMILFIMLVTLA